MCRKLLLNHWVDIDKTHNTYKLMIKNIFLAKRNSCQVISKLFRIWNSTLSYERNIASFRLQQYHTKIINKNNNRQQITEYNRFKNITNIDNNNRLSLRLFPFVAKTTNVKQTIDKQRNATTSEATTTQSSECPTNIPRIYIIYVKLYKSTDINILVWWYML